MHQYDSVEHERPRFVREGFHHSKLSFGLCPGRQAGRRQDASRLDILRDTGCSMRPAR
jgi:hypothetical protein